jgi:hypothetical protein
MLQLHNSKEFLDHLAQGIKTRLRIGLEGSFETSVEALCEIKPAEWLWSPLPNFFAVSTERFRELSLAQPQKYLVLDQGIVEDGHAHKLLVADHGFDVELHSLHMRDLGKNWNVEYVPDRRQFRALTQIKMGQELTTNRVELFWALYPNAHHIE